MSDVGSSSGETSKRRGRGKALTEKERVAILAMADVGKSTAAIAEAIDRSPNAVARILSEAKELLNSRAKDYVELHLQASKVAAADGNANPSQWALERLKVVESPKESTGQGFTVQIGVMLPGLGTAACEVTTVGNDGEVIDAEDVSAT